MTTYFLTQEMYLEAAQLFHWATKDHYNIWFHGSTERSHRTEAVLPRLAKRWANPKTHNRSLYATKYGKRLVYICPRKKRKGDILYKIEHGLGCTDCMVRFWRANMTGKVIEERFFYGCGSIPDFGIQYPKSMLLVEYSSKDNFHQHNVIKNKIAAYRKNLWQIEEKFKVSGIPVFIIDIPKARIHEFLWAITEGFQRPLELKAYFVDYETFKKVPIGEQLSAPIYFYGEDGKTYPLTEDAKH